MDFFPTQIVPFLKAFQGCFSSIGFKYFLGFMWACAALNDRKCLTRIAAGCPVHKRHVSGWSRFFSKSKWSLSSIRSHLHHLVITRLGDDVFFKSYLVAALDTTLMVNFGRKTDGVQKWHDHSGNADRGGYITGHHWGIIGLLVRRATSWVCLPYISRLITGQKSPSWIADGNDVRMANFWDHALGLCREMCLAVHWPLIVVADAYFSKAPFINGMNAMKAILITRLREDAVGWMPDKPTTDDKPGKECSRKEKDKVRLAELLKSLPRQKADIYLYGKPQWVEYVFAHVYLRNVNDLAMVVVVKTG